MNVDIAIVGGGPVGLFLACRLHGLGIDCALVERNADISARTRAIGIHPPSLERFAQMDLADPMIARGHKVLTGMAWNGKRPLGSLDLGTCPPPFNFILTLGQDETERIMENRLTSSGFQGLHRGVRVERIGREGDRYVVEGGKLRLCSRFVIGCDGKYSLVRHDAGIHVKGRPYSDYYVMGDFGDPREDRHTAHIYLCPQGLVESIPLPDRIRRWVLKVDPLDIAEDATRFCDEIRRRTGVQLDWTDKTLIRSFTIERYLAETFVRDGMALAGDSAHVMSPIGGQGMNVGWMDAWDLAEALSAALERPSEREALLHGYNTQARRRARRAIRRATLNTWLGRQRRFAAPRNGLVRVLLNTPVQDRLARRFTMRGL